MLSAFMVVTDAKLWYYEVLLFDLGLVISMITKLKKKTTNNKDLIL